MANTGDTYTVKIIQAHLDWGRHRHTSSRGTVYGEGYIKIPANDARNFNILNSNGTINKQNVLGQNIFNCSSTDGFLTECQLKASGSSQAGDIHAKQLQGNGNLKVIGDWYHHVGAQIGDHVKVEWLNATDIEITLV